MPMEKRTAQFPLVGGLDQRAAPQALLAPQLLTAANVYRARSSEWAHRFGLHYLPAKYLVRGGNPSANSPDKVRALGGRDGNLVLLAKSRWWEYAPALAGFFDVSAVYTEEYDARLCAHDIRLIGLENFNNSLNTDSASGGGYTCIVWEASTTLTCAAIIAEDTGQVVFNNVSLGGKRPKVVWSENCFSIFSVTENGGGTPSVLKYSKITTGGTNGPLVTVTAATVISDLMSTSVGTPWYDIQLRSSGNVLVAYRSSTPSVKALEFDPTGAAISIAAAVVVASDAAANAIGWVYSGADIGGDPTLLTATSAATGVVARSLNTATLAQTAATTILASPGDVASITGRINGSDIFALWELRPADTTLTSIVEGHTNPVSNKPFMGIGSLASKPFRVDGTSWHVTVSHPWDLQPGYYVVPMRSTNLTLDQAPNGVAAAVLPGAGASLAQTRNSLSHIPGVNASTTKFQMPCLRIYDFSSTTTALTILRRPAIATLDFDGQLPRPVSYSRSMIAPGSVCRSWTGDAVGQCGFLLSPEKPTAVAVAGAGVNDGVHQYKCCFTVTDAEGRVWRSAPSPAVSVTTGGGNNAVSVTVKQMFLSSFIAFKNAKNAKIEFYRTKAGGTSYFRIGGGALLVELSGAAQTELWTDTMTDADLETNLPLYTDGGELFNETPGPCVAMAVVGLRIVGIPAEDRTAVIASKEIQPGFGPGWHPDLRLPVVADGDNYAVAAMENRTVVFKRQAIYVLTGDWPSAVGSGSLPIAQKIASGFGTINPASVRESNEGIWFQDPKKGMCLLTRGLEVVQLGVQAPLVAGSDALGVEVAEDDEQVRVLTSGTLFVWDYLEKQWVTWTPQGGASPTCSGQVGGVYYIGHSNGRVSYYNTASYADNYDAGDLVIPVTLDLRFNFAGIEGAQRLYRATVVGTRYAAPSILLKGRFDADYNIGTASAGIDPADVNGTFRQTFRPVVQQGATHVLRLTYSSANQGLAFAAVAVEYGVRAGLRKLGAASIQ